MLQIVRLGQDMNSTNYDGQTVLHLAASRGHCSVIEVRPCAAACLVRVQQARDLAGAGAMGLAYFLATVGKCTNGGVQPL